MLRLKHCPTVVFAGVDSPEDITDQTYQELFHTGGFVVSDNEVLETVTLGESLVWMQMMSRFSSWLHLQIYQLFASKNLPRASSPKREQFLPSDLCLRSHLDEWIHIMAPKNI